MVVESDPIVHLYLSQKSESETQKAAQIHGPPSQIHGFILWCLAHLSLKRVMGVAMDWDCPLEPREASVHLLLLYGKVADFYLLILHSATLHNVAIILGVSGGGFGGPWYTDHILFEETLAPFSCLNLSCPIALAKISSI